MEAQDKQGMQLYQIKYARHIMTLRYVKVVSNVQCRLVLCLHSMKLHLPSWDGTKADPCIAMHGFPDTKRFSCAAPQRRGSRTASNL